MEAYTSFAEVYDTFMDNVPYEEWAEYLAELLQEYDIEDGLVLDLGCGTGSLTEILATKGYDMAQMDQQRCWKLPWRRKHRVVMTSCICCRICENLNFMVRYVLW